MDITTIILDIIDNSIEAKAKNVDVSIIKDGEKIVLSIKDDGRGMSQETLLKADSPTFSTKGTNRGNGLFNLKQFTNENNGNLMLYSVLETGTTVNANWVGTFNKQFLLGLAQTMSVLINQADDINFSVKISNLKKEYEFISNKVKEQLAIQSFKDCQIIKKVKNMFIENIKSMEEIV